MPSNRFFYTSRVNDQSLLDTTYASLFEVIGNTITVKAAIDAGLSPVYRLSNKAGFHLYTAEINERTTSLTDAKFQDEGIEGYAIKINPNASCPTSPSVTYPVYRLSHNGSYKYRLVTDSALKSQLLTLGYSDEGVLFCATAVSATPAAGGAASCNFGSTTLAHGATATGYSSATEPCASQAVTCNNGNLSNSTFHFNTCSAAATVPAGSVTDYCPGSGINAEFDAAGGYHMYYGSRDRGADKWKTIPYGQPLVIKLNVAATDTTVGRYVAYIEFSDFEGPSAGRQMTISRSKCDYTSSAFWVSPSDGSPINAGSTAIAINEANRVEGGVLWPNLTTGTWYINVKSTNCPVGNACVPVVKWLN